MGGFVPTYSRGARHAIQLDTARSSSRRWPPVDEPISHEVSHEDLWCLLGFLEWLSSIFMGWKAYQDQQCRPPFTGAKSCQAGMPSKSSAAWSQENCDLVRLRGCQRRPSWKIQVLLLRFGCAHDRTEFSMRDLKFLRVNVVRLTNSVSGHA